MELQYSEHQQSDTIEQLEYKVQTQTDAIKHYKKVGRRNYSTVNTNKATL